jgi:hypothetical protein
MAQSKDRTAFSLRSKQSFDVRHLSGAHDEHLCRASKSTHGKHFRNLLKITVRQYSFLTFRLRILSLDPI